MEGDGNRGVNEGQKLRLMEVFLDRSKYAFQLIGEMKVTLVHNRGVLRVMMRQRFDTWEMASAELVIIALVRREDGEHARQNMMIRSSLGS